MLHDLVEAYKRPVLYLALDLTGNLHDAEDLAQDVFLKAFKGLEGYRGEASPLTWLRRITVNTYLNRKRSRMRSLWRLMADGRVPEEVDPAPSPQRLAESGDLSRHIDEALGHLTDRERTAFVLRHYQDLSVREVADLMGVAEGTVKSLLFRGTRKMQVRLAPLREVYR